MAVITNLDAIVANAAAQYIRDNSSIFKSTVAGDTGATGPQGDKGDTGIAGEDGTSVEISDVIDNTDGTYTWEFSDGSSFTTSDLRGDKGDKGDDGVQGLTGEQGISVHHTKGTSTTDPEGDFNTPGELDTYTFYGDADETLNLGWYTVANGDSAYTSAVKGGFEGTEAAFNASLGELSELVNDVADAVDTANLAVSQVSNKVNYSDITSDLGTESVTQPLSATAGKVLNEKIEALTLGDIADTGTLKSMLLTERQKLSQIEAEATKDQTGAEIKALYEAEADTNTLTDVYKGKLDNLPSNTNQELSDISITLSSDDATLDTVQDIVDFIKDEAETIANLTTNDIAESTTLKYITPALLTKLGGIEAGATADQTANEIEALYDSKYVSRNTSRFLNDAETLYEADTALDSALDDVDQRLAVLETVVEW